LWVGLEVSVVTAHRLGFGLTPWLVLHLGFLFLFSGFVLGFYEIAFDAVDGKNPKLRKLTGLFYRAPSFFLAFCIYFVLVLCGILLLVVPGIYFAVRYALFGQVLATRSTSAFGALRDAAALSNGHWWILFTLLLIAFVLNLAGAAVLGLGLLIAFPISILAMSDLFRSLLRPTR
jgi:uncharacterized membrane protein